MLGLAALNIAMPLFNLLTGLGLLLGMGGATLFALKGWKRELFFSTVNCRWDHWTDFYATGSLF